MRNLKSMPSQGLAAPPLIVIALQKHLTRADESLNLNVVSTWRRCVPCTFLLGEHAESVMRYLKRGATLIELLIVIAIISLLIQLALPAVQSARESARQNTCSNNLRQLALAAQLHLNTHKHLPTGGWTSVWVGDPQRGFGADQPGGWNYNLLPYLEQQALHDRGKGLPDAELHAEAARMFATPVSVFVCPSRRPVLAWPFDRILFNADDVDLAGRSDYAANIGNLVPMDHPGPGPKTYEEAKTWKDGTDRLTQWVATYHNGVVHQRSRVELKSITDGLSNTYLCGEKFLSPQHYETGESHGDDQSLYVGFDRDNARSTNVLHPPHRDDYSESVHVVFGDDERIVDWNFGSAHPGGFHMAACDGSVERISYDIDPRVFVPKGSRDGTDPDSE